MESMCKETLRQINDALAAAADAGQEAHEARLAMSGCLGSFCSLCGGFVAPGEAVPAHHGTGHETCVALDVEMATTGGAVRLPGYVYQFVGNLSATAEQEVAIA